MRVADLAWTGQHAQAIEVATAALAAAGADIALRIDLLDLRAESFVALGELDRASADAAAMLELAATAKRPRSKRRRSIAGVGADAQGRGCRPRSHRHGRAEGRAPEQAIGAGRDEPLSSRRSAVPRQGGRASGSERDRAAELFAALDQPANQGRALWALSDARSNQGRAAEGDRAASDALALGRRCGDLYGVGNALNMLMFNEADIATALKLLNQALAAFEAAGYLERQGVVTFNLGIPYGDLGLYRRARRTLLKARDIHVARAVHGAAQPTAGFWPPWNCRWGISTRRARTSPKGRRARRCARNVAFLGSEPVLRGRARLSRGRRADRAASLPARGEAAPRREAGRRRIQRAGAARAGASGHG